MPNHFDGPKTTINSCNSNQALNSNYQILSLPLINDMDETLKDVYTFVPSSGRRCENDNDVLRRFGTWIYNI
jgi:hypothetical protein